ncbi:hypothetical protein MRB53_022958 [Persea americana]|uniref:Uncharacterized protein n=1 Tax=Persea americana TaxID=3435 RepID=A0ACC2L8F2_PERAE|nr:hypothetical protein MRB53_022958 [Persea americana]
MPINMNRAMSKRSERNNRITSIHWWNLFRKDVQGLGGCAAVRGEGGAVEEAEDVGEDVGWEGGEGGGTAGFSEFRGVARCGICG